MKTWIPDMLYRAACDELMDAPDCDETRLLRTVRQFSSINRLVSRYRTILKREVLADMMKEPGREYHLVDMGAGGCDIDAWLLQSAQRLGLKLRISACDLDPRIIRYARTTYGDTPGLDIRRLDLLQYPPEEPVDYVFANHFLHHLTDQQIKHLLGVWAPRTRRRMVLSDLRRSSAAYLGYAALSLFYPASFARTDGLISIRRGFLPGELQALADTALPENRHTVLQYSPGRLVLRIECSALPNDERTVN
ncbi:methyltransferase [Pontiella agarivorans]|uniref:Methyltransferase domain-containing protein n=1 Tax=Pontiella agarivorans TaxID=3038953 RepID=A0ABU5MZW5_9BACT|nr:methyltransferase [Pontiella agarivorans]MDZ8119714.1 methyltransferase domain-containing protein [Pontiella agarivorans]